MIALGIDCATKAGWSLVENAGKGEELLDHGVLNLDGKKLPAWNQVSFLALRCRKPGLEPNVVAIELPWLGKNVATTIVLARLCGRFEQAFDPSAKVELVRASEWQASILGRFGGKSRETLKKASKDLVKRIFKEDVTEDEADATWIAVSALRKAKIEAARKRVK